MKKLLSLFVSLVLVLTCCTYTVLATDSVKVILDGEIINFDVPAQIIDGRTMVPMRKIFESMGAAVDWNGDTQTITAQRKDITVIMQINNYVITVNGNNVTLDVPPQLVNSRTLVPARAVAESFNAKVDWDGNTNSVIISSTSKGNSNGNLANGGHFVFSDEWIYYCKDSKICKMKTDGTNKQIILNEYATSLNIVNDWLYYVSNNKICKMKTDGTEKTILSSIDRVNDCMVIDNNTIYFVDGWGGLFKANLDGNNITRIADVTTLFFQVEGEWIYYNPEISPSGLTFGNICRIRTDGTQQSKIIDSSTYDFNVVDGWIYYDNAEYQNSGLFKARIDGSGKQKLAEKKEITTINVAGDWIYYFTYYDLYSDPIQGELRKVDLNGQNDTFIKKCDTEMFYIGTSSNMIACDGFDNSDIILLSDNNSNTAIKNGYGTLYDVLGKREYEGELKNGEPNGIGTVFYEDGYTKFYHGEFKDGIPHGFGTIYYEDGGKKFEGELPTGTGTFYEEKTERIYYIGEHVDLVCEGKGTYFQEDGKYYKGEFKNGKFHGRGTAYNKDGTVIVSGEFENGNLVSENNSTNQVTSNQSSYQEEYDTLIEWGNQKVQEIYEEADRIYEETIESEKRRYFPNYDKNLDAFAAANMQRQIQALMPTIMQSAELASKAYEAEALETLAAFLQEQISELKQKYNIKN